MYIFDTTQDGAPLGKEDSLNLAFADKLVKSPEFVSWLLSRTKFREHASDARLMHEEQSLVRTARFWWRHWWCNPPESGGGSETDIFLVFETARTLERFCLHVENKISTSMFTPNQERNYAVRARHMLNNTKSAQFHCTDFDTVLIAPKSFRDKYREQCDLFGQFIDHNEIAPFVSEFGESPIDTAKMPLSAHDAAAPSFACPACGSENTQKITLVYGAGTSNYSSRSISTSSAFARRGVLRITSTIGNSSSALAQLNSPSQKKTFNVIGYIFGALLIAGLAGAISGSVSLAILTLVVAACIAATRIIKMGRYNNSEYLRRYKHWAEQFVCLRCENKFHVARKKGTLHKEYSIYLNIVGTKKINVIKIVRELTHLGLAEAKRLVESAPTTVISGVPEEQAEIIKFQFEAAGASVELR